MPADDVLRGPSDQSESLDEPIGRYPSTAALPEDERHRVLASERRRHVLGIAAARPAPIPLEALAAAVVAREDADPADDETREHAVISLHHVHLPLLDDHGVVEYDPNERELLA
ncbi:DUF7344 domain-containing protein [Halobaculum roseum]|uniref:DUF7344 domain-containing protein n=1 Tax=Halobaculum roseum TaxID=2175149 RepID=A0ABD5MQQ8_9EURY|nr:hypothetical protein [Halobaculum roseum]QZY03731.1 hypothetical protein K6T36_06090 [Halobaculum roseum]